MSGVFLKKHQKSISNHQNEAQKTSYLLSPKQSSKKEKPPSAGAKPTQPLPAKAPPFVDSSFGKASHRNPLRSRCTCGDLQRLLHSPHEETRAAGWFWFVVFLFGVDVFLFSFVSFRCCVSLVVFCSVLCCFVGFCWLFHRY